MKSKPDKQAAAAVGAFEAKTNLGQLLDRVERGETLTITRHGVPIARLVPFRDEVDRTDARRAIESLRKFGEGNRLPAGMTIKDMIREGRM